MDNILLLKKEIYDKELILRATRDYSGIAKISCDLSDEYWTCIFEATKYPLDKTQKEFENYLIALENKKGGLNDSL